MNDRELDLALDRLGVEHVRRTAPSTLRDRVHVVPLENKRRPWLPSFPTWRFQSMFSATKFVVGGAIVALFGGFLLAGVMTTQEGARAPGAAIDDGSMAPAAFTAVINAGGGGGGTTTVTDEGLTLISGYWEGGDIEDATDPRIAGGWGGVWSWVVVVEEELVLYNGVYEIRNDGGRWTGTSSGIGGCTFVECPAGVVDSLDPDIPRDHTILLHGEDGYAGLTAYMNAWIGPDEGGFGADVAGVIIPAALPQAPDITDATRHFQGPPYPEPTR